LGFLRQLQILEELVPLTKVLGKFLKTWGERQTTRAKYSEEVSTPLSITGQDHADVALTISRRLIDVVKVKNILHIEAGLEMIALAMAISSEVCNIGSFERYLFNFSL
jgi:hypothetical protein